jgi:translation elongation factor P/translation initiation factor 5A
MAERVNDIRRGQVLEHNGGLFLVISIMHSQPGKGDAYIHAEMKNIKTEQNTMKDFALMQQSEGKFLMKRRRIEASSIDRSQQSRFYLMTREESSLETLWLKSTRTMDKVQITDPRR